MFGMYNLISLMALGMWETGRKIYRRCSAEICLIGSFILVLLCNKHSGWCLAQLQRSLLLIGLICEIVLWLMQISRTNPLSKSTLMVSPVRCRAMGKFDSGCTTAIVFLLPQIRTGNCYFRAYI